ncbi:MAG: hypothetical protein ACI9XO_001463 [Paraglaciecola sp.]|jgi:hypothetical protein
MKFITAACLFCLIFLACGKEENTIKIQYEIVCECNFWEESECDTQDIEAAIACYFVTGNIKNYDVTIIEYGQAVACIICCNCPEGKRADVKIEERDLPTFLELGFTVDQ